MSTTISDQDTPNFIAGHWKDKPTRYIHTYLQDRANEIQELRETLDERPGNVLYIAEEALFRAECLTGVEPTSPDLLGLLQLHARATAAAVMRLAPGDEPVEVDLGGPPVRLKRATRPIDIHPRKVITAFHAAAATGDGTAQRMLMAAPLERVRRAQQTADDEPARLHMLGLRAQLRRDPDWADLLIGALTAYNAMPDDALAKDFCLRIASREAELAMRAYDPEAIADFDPALREALVEHRTYYVKYGPANGNLQEDPSSFLALGPLGFATTHKDLGMPCAITSDYMPAGVLELGGKK